jgi:hypothetical protein
VRQAEQLRQYDAGLSVAEVVGLEAGEDQVGRFGFQRGGEQAGRSERVVGADFLFLDMDGAVGALGERFANGLRGARGTGTERDYFSAVLFLELQPCFQGIRVRLVDLIREIGILDPLGRR